MSESDVELAELRFLEAHLQHRARICYAMVAAGMVCLVAGVVMLIVGLTGDQVVWVRTGNLKITTGGGGAVTMLASVAWGYVAYRSRPEIDYSSPSRGMTLGPPGPRFAIRSYVAQRVRYETRRVPVTGTDKMSLCLNSADFSASSSVCSPNLEHRITCRISMPIIKTK